MEKEKSWVEFGSDCNPIKTSEDDKESKDKVICVGDMTMLIGQILTALECAMEPTSQQFALKRTIKNFCWTMWELLEETK